MSPKRCRYERPATRDDDQAVVARLLALWRAVTDSPPTVDFDRAVLADDALLDQLAVPTISPNRSTPRRSEPATRTTRFPGALGGRALTGDRTITVARIWRCARTAHRLIVRYVPPAPSLPTAGPRMPDVSHTRKGWAAAAI